MAHSILLRDTLQFHTGGVTAIACPSENSDTIVTSSRDKSLRVWKLTKEDGRYLVNQKSLLGHGDFVQDVAITDDGKYALSGSWDKDIRLWDLDNGITSGRFVGHSKEVLSVALSTDHRIIASASRDNTIKLWNTVGVCRHNIQGEDGGHNDWVSSVRFIPNSHGFVSGSWDTTVKLWDGKDWSLRANFMDHAAYINTVAVNHDGDLCASGGEDGTVLLWDLTDGNRFYSLETCSIIHCLSFRPESNWLCAATESGIWIWDLMRDMRFVANLTIDGVATRTNDEILKVFQLLFIEMLTEILLPPSQNKCPV